MLMKIGSGAGVGWFPSSDLDTIKDESVVLQTEKKEDTSDTSGVIPEELVELLGLPELLENNNVTRSYDELISERKKQIFAKYRWSDTVLTSFLLAGVLGGYLGGCYRIFRVSWFGSYVCRHST